MKGPVNRADGNRGIGAAFVEEVIGLSLDRSNAALALRLQATRRFSAGLTLAAQWTHGGLASTEIDTDVVSAAVAAARPARRSRNSIARRRGEIGPRQ